MTYQTGKSTHDAYRELRDMTSQALLNNEEEVMILSLDMLSAFDVVQRDFMEALLKRMNLPDHYIESLFRHLKTVRAKRSQYTRIPHRIRCATRICSKRIALHTLSGSNSSHHIL